MAYAEAPTLYGKANISLNQVDLETSGEDEWDLVSNASRIGVKGGYDINPNLKAIYKLEYEVFLDDGDDGSLDDNEDSNKSEFSQRNVYAGFQGNWGTLVAGKHDTPLKMAQGTVDRFNDLQVGDIKEVLNGENRESDIVMYTTPKMGDLSATVAVTPGEETDGDDGVADSVSLALNYMVGNLSLALANDSEVAGWDITRAVAEYAMGDFKLGLLIQDGEESDTNSDGDALNDEELDGFVISGEYAINKIILKAQYAESDHEAVAFQEDITQINIGADYKLDDNSMVFAYLANVEHDEDGADSEDDDVLGVGYEIKF
jgi:predicted porin